MKKINVLQVVLEIGRAGLEILVVELCKRLDRDKYNVSILCFYSCTPEFEEELDREGIDVYVINRKGTYDIGFFLKIIKLMKEKEIDIVHSHSGCFFNASICAYLAKIGGVIFTAHGMPVETGFQARTEDKIAAYMSDRIVAVSDEIENEMLRQFPSRKDKIIQVTNGVDTERFSPHRESMNVIDIKKAYNIPHDKRVIGTVGRLEEVKNYEMLIRSFARLYDMGPKNIHLVFIGDGYERKKLERLAGDLDLSEHVSFLGVQTDMKSLLSIVDIFALSSLTEGTSVALLEAQSCGIPAVVTRVGGNDRVIKEGINGYLCELHNVDEMADKMYAILSNSTLMDDMRINARSVVEERFNISSMVSSYEKIYDEVAV